MIVRRRVVALGMRKMSAMKMMYGERKILTRIPAFVQLLYRLLGFCFPFISCVDVANKMVSNIIANMKFE